MFLIKDSVRTAKPVVVYGASGHAKVVLDILRSQRIYEVVAVLDGKTSDGVECGACRVSGNLDRLPALTTEHSNLEVIVAVADNWLRSQLTDEVRALCPRVRFGTAIHPSAIVARDASIGEGAVIMAGAVVNPTTYVGEGCIVNTRASLDHDSAMASFASLAPAAAVGNGVRIGAYSNVGIGASVIQEISIGAHTVVGAGAVVVRNLPDFVVAYGVPARVVRSRQPGDRYLSEVHTAT